MRWGPVTIDTTSCSVTPKNSRQATEQIDSTRISIRNPQARSGSPDQDSMDMDPAGVIADS